MNQVREHQTYRTCVSFKVNTGGYRMENIVTFGFAYLSLFESFQALPAPPCNG